MDRAKTDSILNNIDGVKFVNHLGFIDKVKSIILFSKHCPCQIR